MADYTKYEKQVEEFRGRAKYLEDKAIEEGRPMTEGEVREHEQLYGRIQSTHDLISDLKNEEIERLTGMIAHETQVEKADARSANEMFRAMRHNDSTEFWAPELRDWATTTATASALVGQDWHAEYLSRLFEASVARQSGMYVIRTASTHNIPMLASTGSAAIVAENTAYVEDDPVTVNVQLGAYKMTKRIDVPEELLADTSYDVAGLLAAAAGQAFGFGQDKIFISVSGTGSGTASGIFKAVGATASSNGSAGNDHPITAQNLIDLVYALPRAYRTKDACWYMNDTTLGYIARARTTPSAVEGLLWTDAIAGEPAKLFGYPVYTHTGITAITTASSSIIAFGNPKFYAIGERGPMNARAMQLNEYSTSFVFSQRIDGKPLTSSAFVVMQSASGA